MIKSADVLYELAISDNLWKRRIAIISTLRFIKDSDFKDTIRISELLLQDKHDLIHKAVGWMLREAGKRDVVVLEKFLKKHYLKMPPKIAEEKRPKIIPNSIYPPKLSP